MLTHENIWQAIDRLAESFGYSASGLAKQAGLDPTSFNKSKRTSPDGKPRWPSTESISRILAATGASMSDFLALVDDDVIEYKDICIPVMALSRLSSGKKGYFDEDGLPVTKEWDELQLPEFKGKPSHSVFAIEVDSDDYNPLYRNGDVIVADITDDIREADRIVIKSLGGEVALMELDRKESDRYVVVPLEQVADGDSKAVNISVDEVSRIARIIWVSQ
jgi:phage repressor protein C with HTH and peptisase S24 domain